MISPLKQDGDEGKHLQKVFGQRISLISNIFHNESVTNTIANNASNDADHLASQLIILSLRIKEVDKAGRRSNKTSHREFVMHLKIFFFVSIFP